MKKICRILLILIIESYNCISFDYAHSLSKTTTYAKALSECVLYKSPSMNTDVDNVYFIVPESYFVVVLEKTSESVMKVQYDKFVGYIFSNKVVIATFVPESKFLENVTLDIKESSGTQVWSKPTTSGNVLTTISAGTMQIKYIASAYGAIPSGGITNLWYYISYTPSFNATNVYEGYVYSENVTNLSQIVLNMELNPEVIQKEIDTNIIYLSSTVKTILITIISIPIILLFLIILYKLSKKFVKNTKYDSFSNKINVGNLQDEKLNSNNSHRNEQKINSPLSKFSKMYFVKRNANSKKESKSYPIFPAYDSEDDLL